MIKRDLPPPWQRNLVWNKRDLQVQREQEQFEFNIETLEQVSQSLSFVQSLKSLVDLEDSDNQDISALILKLDDSLNAASKFIVQRNKLIRIADKSEAGWAAVGEYLFDEVASGSEDEKICAADQRALKKKKNSQMAKKHLAGTMITSWWEI